MKFTTLKKIDPSLLGERVIKEYSYRESMGESDDGMRRGYSYTVHCKVYGEIKDETKNEDGTYTYEYSSRVENDETGIDTRNPKDEYDLKNMMEELLFNYNIHEFSTELQEEPNNIKDYYASIDANASYKKDKEPYFSYSWSTYSKDSKDYKEPDNTIWSSYERLKSESLDDMNEQLNGAFSKDDYILYLMGNEVKKTYRIMLGLDDIEENETVRDFLGRMKLESLKYPTFESALEENVITMEDIKGLILKYKNLSANEISTDILEQLFIEDKQLISHFSEREMPIDILRKYSPNFDITKVSPNDLIPSDLDNVLQNVIQSNYILGIYNGPSEKELKQGYFKYLQSFYDNPEALRKIIPVINTSREYFFTSQAQEYISQISPKVLETNEVRDILLDTEGITLSQVLKYDLDYDLDSAKKLMKILGKTTSKTSLKDINSILSIMQKEGIDNSEILQALRENEFNISMSGIQNEDEEIEKFKSFKIEGITLDDVKDNILKNKDFNYINLIENISEKDITRLFYNMINGSAEKNNIGYEKIFEIMFNYSDVTTLLSGLNKEIKELTKKLIIEKLDVIEVLQKSSIKYSADFSRIMEIMTKSFDISNEDILNIYRKCLNNGNQKEDIISVLKRYIPEEGRKEFENRVNSENFYPNPKYFWLTDKNLTRININRGENRNTIKSKIQADGKCFSTKIKTDMIGQDNDGNRIPVNNLSKWLFGVPGARGYLTITRYGDCIQLPGNTPKEAVELIQSVLRQKEEISK